MKALENGSALTVYIAGDADERVTAPVVQLCREKGIRIYNVDTMAELGKACNIKVGAAVAAIIER
jgi:large subunit ribosomal protein L7A